MELPSHLTRIADGVHLWDTRAPSGSWGHANCVLITSNEQAAVVDTPYDPVMTAAFQRACTRVLPEHVRITTIVNTHPNGDHSWGNSMFPDAEIIASHNSFQHIDHELTPAQMTGLQSRDDALGWYVRSRFGQFCFDRVEVREPTVLFQEDHSLRVGDLDVRLFDVGPAHTHGDTIVFIPQAGTVVAGDVLFNGDHPVHWQGPLENVIGACAAILALDAEHIVPGHGRPMTRDDVRRHMDYLGELRDAIHAAHACGRDVLAAVDAIVEPDFHPDMGAAERLAIITAIEYAHLDGVAPPTPQQLAPQAAQWAYDHEQHPAAAV